MHAPPLLPPLPLPLLLLLLLLPRPRLAPREDGRQRLRRRRCDMAAPAGRLTTTAYAQDFTTRPMSDMSLRNITYKHYLGTPVYPFGYVRERTTASCCCCRCCRFRRRCCYRTWRCWLVVIELLLADVRRTIVLLLCCFSAIAAVSVVPSHFHLMLCYISFIVAAGTVVLEVPGQLGQRVCS